MNKVQGQGSVDVYPSGFYMPLSQEEADFLMSWVPPGKLRPIGPKAIEAYNLRENGTTYKELSHRFGTTRRRVKVVIRGVDKRRALARQQGAWRGRG